MFKHDFTILLFVIVFHSSFKTINAYIGNHFIKRVGVIIAPGFEMLDAMGPYETMKEVQEHYYTHIDVNGRTWDIHEDTKEIECISTSEGRKLQIVVEFAAVFNISQDGRIEPISSSSGVSIQPEFDIASDPEGKYFDMLVVGAGVETEETIEYFKKHYESGRSIMTVCTGAAIPAKLGYLDGVEATTNSLFLKAFNEDFPLVKWVSLADDLERRYIQSTPQIITTAGITAGIDGALYKIEEWCGRDVAEAIRQSLEWPLQLPINKKITYSKLT